MSAEATVWAWRQELPANEKLLLLAIADEADDRGGAETGQPHLAKKTGAARSTVSANLKRLRDRGLLDVERRYRPDGGREQDALRIPLESGPTPPSESGPTPPRRPDASARADETLGETATPRSSSARTSLAIPLDAGVEVPEEMQQDAAAFLGQRKKVDGKLVTPEEMAKAACALAAFNEEAGADQGLASSLERIVMRVRERPSWDEAKHVRLVRSAFRVRWWERNGGRRRGQRLTPAVIYGNAQCFENVVQDAKDEAAGETERIEKRRGKYDRSVTR